MLKQEAMGRIGINLDRRVGQEAAKQVRVARRNHPVTVSVGDKYRLRYAGQPLQQTDVGDAPLHDGVVVRGAGWPVGRFVAVIGASKDAAEKLAAGYPAGLGRGEERVQQL